MSLTWVLAWLALVILVVAPVLALLVVSLSDDTTGRWTLANFRDAFGTWRYIRALLNTVKLGAAVLVGSALLALPLAWAVSRTDIRAKGFIRGAALSSFLCPPYLGAAAWILLAGPHAGFINKLWARIAGGTEPLVNVYSFTGMAFVMSASLFFFLFSFACAALAAASSDMEEAAAILGASRLRTALRITLPLATPAILGGLIMVFLQAIALYGVPAFLAYPARFPVLVTMLTEFFSMPVRVGLAAAYTLPLLVVTGSLIALRKRLMRRRSYVVISGKGGERRLIQLGQWRPVATLAAVALCAVVCVLPLVVLVMAAFSRVWSQGLTADNLTLANFAELARDPILWQSLTHSFLYALAAAVLGSIVALLAAYLVVRRKAALAALLEFTAMAPYVIPGIVLAIGYYATFAAPPVALYGSGLLLIMAFTTRFLPIAYTSASSALATMDAQMEEAARILGARPFYVFRRVTFPVIKRSLMAAAILIFILSSHELSVAVFLAGPNTRVVSITMLDVSQDGRFEALAAMGVALMVMTMLSVAIGNRLLGRDFMLKGGDR